MHIAVLGRYGVLMREESDPTHSPPLQVSLSRALTPDKLWGVCRRHGVPAVVSVLVLYAIRAKKIDRFSLVFLAPICVVWYAFN